LAGIRKENGILPVTCGRTAGERRSRSASVYSGERRALLAVASWATEKVTVAPDMHLRAMRIDPARARFRLPSVKDFQNGKNLAERPIVDVYPARGCLVIVEEGP
jgi:hypothetical protein